MFFLPLRIACCSCASLVAAAYGCYAEVGWGQAEPGPQALSFTDPSTSLNQPWWCGDVDGVGGQILKDDAKRLQKGAKWPKSRKKTAKWQKTHSFFLDLLQTAQKRPKNDPTWPEIEMTQDRPENSPKSPQKWAYFGHKMVQKWRSMAPDIWPQVGLKMAQEGSEKVKSYQKALKAI